jgi:cytochrome c oxidase subunit 4
MPERVQSPAIYVAVFVALFLLVPLNVGLSFVPLPGTWHLVIGLTIGLVMAVLTVLFYMHASVSSPVIWVVIAAAIMWTIVLFSLTLSDYFTRGLVPYTPGH